MKRMRSNKCILFDFLVFLITILSIATTTNAAYDLYGSNHVGNFYEIDTANGSRLNLGDIDNC